MKGGRPVSFHVSAGRTCGMRISLRAGAVHLLTHDVRDLGEHAQAERQVRVDPRTLPAHEPAAQEQDVARRDRFGGRLLHGRDEELTVAHDYDSSSKR